MTDPKQAAQTPGALLSLRDAQGDTPIVVAAKAGQTEIIHELLRPFDAASPEYEQVILGAEPGEFGVEGRKEGRKALQAAVENGDRTIVQFLLKNCSPQGKHQLLEMRDPHGNLPLCTAAKLGHAHLIDPLLVQGKDPHDCREFIAQQRRTENGPNALDQGQLTFFNDVLELVLDPLHHPTDPSLEAVMTRGERLLQVQRLFLAPPQGGGSILHRAKTEQAVETVLDYIPEGYRAPFIGHHDLLEETALYRAVGEGRDDVVRALIAGVPAGQRQGIHGQENGVNVQTALHNARTPAAVEAFCDGLSPDERRNFADERIDQNRNTALACAIQRGDADVAEAPLRGFTPEQEVDSIARNRGGVYPTLLHQAVHAAGRGEPPHGQLPRIPLAQAAA